MLDGKTNGSFLELGASYTKFNNNTYTLETFFDFKGISIDVENRTWEHYNQFNTQVDAWQNERLNSNFILTDAIEVNYSKLLKDMPNQIDYLQIDIDNDIGQLIILKNLLTTRHRFSVITYEHDLYNYTLEGGHRKIKTYKEKAQQLLIESGYKLLIENVGCINGMPGQKTEGKLVPFEDWYIDSQVIDNSIYNLFENIGSDCIDPTKIFVV